MNTGNLIVRELVGLVLGHHFGQTEDEHVELLRRGSCVRMNRLAFDNSAGCRSGYRGGLLLLPPSKLNNTVLNALRVL